MSSFEFAGATIADVCRQSQHFLMRMITSVQFGRDSATKQAAVCCVWQDRLISPGGDHGTNLHGPRMTDEAQCELP